MLCLSQRLFSWETKYSIIESEAWAVKWAFKALRYYLIGSPFRLVTDHAPLWWINTMWDTNAQFMRWHLSLQP